MEVNKIIRVDETLYQEVKDVCKEDSKLFMDEITDIVNRAMRKYLDDRQELFDKNNVDPLKDYFEEDIGKLEK